MKLSLIEKLRKIIIDNSNQNYTSIASYLIENFNVDYSEITIFTLAKKTYTSAPTITRFCKKIGVDGYKELVFLLKDKQHEVLNNINSQVINTPIYERHNIFTGNVIQAIEKSNKTNYEKIDLLVKKMLTSEKLYFFCIGSNVALVRNITDLLIRMNFNVVFSESIEQQNACSENISPNDFVLFLSVSLSDPNFEKLISKKNVRSASPFFITKRTTAKALSGISITNILEIGESENTLGSRFVSEISIFFILKSILIHLANDELKKSINVNNI